MSIQDLRERFGEYGKDIKLNLGTVLGEDGAPGLSQKQIYGVALASAYALKNAELVSAVLETADDALEDADINAAKIAASIMAMNNVYYRYLGQVKDEELSKKPANMRMNQIKSHGVEQVDFELYELAVSIINGCTMCINAHVKAVVDGGHDRAMVHSVSRIAATIHAAAQVLFIEETEKAAAKREAA